MHFEELTLTAASRPRKIEFQAIVFAIVLLTVLFLCFIQSFYLSSLALHPEVVETCS